MSARQRRGGSTPAPVQAYDTLLLALLQRVTLSDWHLFITPVLDVKLHMVWWKYHFILQHCPHTFFFAIHVLYTMDSIK
jgi:hypothetical protein